VLRAARQAEGEDRALAHLARHGHVAAHHARELAREGKPEPGPAVAARGEGIGLGEILEECRSWDRAGSGAAFRYLPKDGAIASRNLLGDVLKHFQERMPYGLFVPDVP